MAGIIIHELLQARRKSALPHRQALHSWLAT